MQSDTLLRHAVGKSFDSLISRYTSDYVIFLDEHYSIIEINIEALHYFSWQRKQVLYSNFLTLCEQSPLALSELILRLQDKSLDHKAELILTNDVKSRPLRSNWQIISLAEQDYGFSGTLLMGKRLIEQHNLSSPMVLSASMQVRDATKNMKKLLDLLKAQSNTSQMQYLLRCLRQELASISSTLDNIDSIETDKEEANHSAQQRVSIPLATKSAVNNVSVKQCLLVENDPITRLMNKMLLEKKGFNVDIATDIASALEYYNEQYDVILTALQLPDGHGLSLVKQLRQQQDAQQLIIVLTADLSADMEERCLAAGVNACFNKPIDPQKLKKIFQLIQQPHLAALAD